MRKTSLSWPLASLGLALALAGCNQPATPPDIDSPPAAPPVKPAAETTLTPAAAPDSRLAVSVLEGTLTVSLNGRKVGDYGSTIQVDATPYLRPGKNVLKLDWEANTRGMAKVEYALAATPEKYNAISNFQLTSPASQKAGSKSFEFNLPNPDGSLPADEATATDTSSTAPSSTEASPAPEAGDSIVPVPDVTVPPSPNGVESNSAPAPETKAPDNGVKAIMSVSANDAPISVSLNGQNVGDFQSYLKLDVGRYLKPGANSLKVVWTKKTYFDVKVAYFSSDANDYRDVSRTRLYNSDTIKPGSRTISFQVPGS